MRALVATERALRGETVGGDLSLEVLGTPFAPMEWEPDYPAAIYRSDRADFPAPDPVALQPLNGDGERERVDDPDSEDALFGLVRTWVEESNGRAHVVTVEGKAVDAIRAVANGQVDGSAVPFREALALMAWAGANGGAYGSRRGGPVGRSAAWAVVAALADLDWPADPAEIEASGSRFNWWWWEPHSLLGGWHLGIGVDDPGEGLAWAISGRDELEAEAPPDAPG